ncbi:hypothetical protein F4804DRAFT_311152 [Jackrogersella minutella]|nr:hypothetical protein F4804DRAFT_311152 [Jackrogersella minutella]
MSLLGNSGHPVYSGVALPWQERLQLGRRCGKYDFGRFERLRGSGHYLGRGNIGDIDVACKFLFRESRWGVLSPDKNPGGVVYLDLTFTEPPGCRLRGATVVVTLDEEDKDLQRHFSSVGSRSNPDVSVQITEYGPRKLHGQLDEAFKVKNTLFTPSVNVLGTVGVGGVGYNSETRQILQSQWKFSGQPISNRLAKATVLKWHLVESELDRQSKHDNTFHTGFAFEHDGQPFFMQVEISGYLEGTALHLWQKTKHRFKKFKFPVEPQAATTLVNFGGRNNPYQDPLDELAKNLPHDMVERNMRLAPQIPRNTHNPGPYYEVEEEISTINEETDMSCQQHPPQAIDNSQSIPIEELRGEALELLSPGRSSIGENGNIYTAEMLSPANSQPETSDGISSAPSSRDETLAGSTIVADQEESEPTDETATPKPHTHHEEVMRLLGDMAIPAWSRLIIIWFLAMWIRNSPALPPSKKNTLSGKGVT